jgi:hypothetical protein
MPKHPKKTNDNLCGEVDWVESELQTLRLGDRRLEKRVKKILRDFAAQPGASIPRASGEWTASKGAYRCLSNPAIDFLAVPGAHREASLERARGQRVLLAVQDTTALNFSTHPATQGLGPIGNNRDKTIGLLLHSTLLLGEDGQALGVLDTQLSARDALKFKAGPKSGRNRKSMEQKESVKWWRSVEATQRAAQVLPGSMLINIADREGDSYELFLKHAQERRKQKEAAAQGNALAEPTTPQVELLIRCQHDRVLGAQSRRLFAHLAAQPVAAKFCFMAPRRPGQPARPVTLSLRFTEVTLPPPVDQAKHQGRRESLGLWAIEAREENPPAGQEPICWRLLSTMPVGDAETARLQVQRYSRRWEIEIFHKILKSGCKAEQRQLETVARLERCLALDVIVAYRILALSKAARGAAGDPPIDQWLAEHEWKALWCRIHRRPDPPSKAPPTSQATRWIAQLGGFLARKGDGHPGPMTLWRGLQRLNDIAEAYLLFTQIPKDMGNA